MKVKSLAQLHAMHKAGDVKSVEGVKFIEPPKPEAPAAPASPPVSLEPLVASLRESMDKQTALSRENMASMYELIRSLARAPQQVPSVPAPRPLRWEFTVVRDADGFVSKIIANASD